MLATMSRMKVEIFCMAAWKIWKEINDWVWPGHHKSAAEADGSSTILLDEWTQALAARSAGMTVRYEAVWGVSCLAHSTKRRVET